MNNFVRNLFLLSIALFYFFALFFLLFLYMCKDQSDRSMINVALIQSYIYISISRIDDSIYNRVFAFLNIREKEEERKKYKKIR